MDPLSALMDAAATAGAPPPAPEPPPAFPRDSAPFEKRGGRNSLPPGYQERRAAVPRAPVGGAPPHRDRELAMRAAMSREMEIQWARGARGAPRGGGGEAPPASAEDALRSIMLLREREEEEAAARIRHLDHLRRRELMFRIAEEEGGGGGFRLPAGLAGAPPPPLPPPEPSELAERRRDMEMRALWCQEQRRWREEEEDEAHRRLLASLAQQRQQEQQRRDLELRKLERQLLAERLADRGALDRLRGLEGCAQGAVLAEGGQHPHSQLLLPRNGVPNDFKKGNSVIVPCQARGMPMEHNFKTAYFVIPEEIEHGEELICSFPPCRNAGIKFRFCRGCGVPVAKRNFRGRHGHGLEDVGAASDEDEEDDVRGGGGVGVVASPKPSSAYPPPDGRKLIEAQRVGSAVNEIRGAEATCDGERRGRWADLLGKRPRTGDSGAMSSWLLEVLTVSDLGNPLEGGRAPLGARRFTGEGNFGPKKAVKYC